MSESEYYLRPTRAERAASAREREAQRESPIWSCAVCSRQMTGGPRCFTHNPLPGDVPAALAAGMPLVSFRWVRHRPEPLTKWQQRQQALRRRRADMAVSTNCTDENPFVAECLRCNQTHDIRVVCRNGIWLVATASMSVAAA